MFRSVLFTCCCLVLNSYIQAAPVDPNTCKDDQLYVVGAYDCSVLIDPEYPAQSSLGFYKNAPTLCGQKIHFDQCCETCTIVLEKANKSSTAPTSQTTPQTIKQTTEQKAAKGEEDIEIIQNSYKTNNGEDTVYDVSVRKQEPESFEEIKITIDKKDSHQKIGLRFPKGNRMESGQPFTIDFY